VDLEPLLVLQEHDLALDRLRHRRAALPERAAVADADAAVTALDAEIDRRRGPLADLTRTQEGHEAEALRLAAQADAADARLYSGEITSPKELQALQADVAQLRRHQSAVEDLALAVMEEREPLEAEVGALEAQRTALVAARDDHRDALRSAEAAVDAEIGAEQGLRDAAAAALAPTVLALYERCRSASATRVGVARLVGSTCQGCRLTIPATEVDALRNAPPGTIAHCDNCGAILVP
jgi:predicted  nucleic acid-binding Zn-ribbon protein